MRHCLQYPSNVLSGGIFLLRYTNFIHLSSFFVSCTAHLQPPNNWVQLKSYENLQLRLSILFLWFSLVWNFSSEEHILKLQYVELWGWQGCYHDSSFSHYTYKPWYSSMIVDEHISPRLVYNISTLFVDTVTSELSPCLQSLCWILSQWWVS